MSCRSSRQDLAVDLRTFPMPSLSAQASNLMIICSIYVKMAMCLKDRENENVVKKESGPKLPNV